MAYNGTAFTGPLFGYNSRQVRNDGSQCGAPSCFEAGGIMSTDPLANNFFIGNFGTLATYPGTNYFYIIPWSGPQNLGLQALIAGSYRDIYNGNYTPSGWSLTALAPGGVPEPGTWVMLLIGFGVIGLSCRRRTKTVLA